MEHEKILQNKTTNIIPPRLKTGDTIGFVSPCDATVPERLEPRIKEYEALGFKIKRGKNLYKNTYGYAASPEERAEDFNSMIYDPEVKLVLFGGGEVGNEILPLIDYEAARKNPKIYSSYSDGTSILNAICAKSGIVTYVGQTSRSFSPPTEYNLSHFRARFMTDSTEYEKGSEWTTIRPGKAEGILFGGYTQNIALLVNSPYMQLDLEKQYILFIEDHEWFSEPAAVCRYLEHISQSPLFKRVTGMIFGQYRNGDQSEIVEILDRFAQKQKLPTIKCDDFGHESNNAIFPVGMYAVLDANRQELKFVL